MRRDGEPGTHFACVRMPDGPFGLFGRKPKQAKVMGSGRLCLRYAPPLDGMIYIVQTYSFCSSRYFQDFRDASRVPAGNSDLVLRHVRSPLNGIVMIPQSRVISPYRRLLHPGRALHPLQTRSRSRPLQISFTSRRYNATDANSPPKRPQPAHQTKPISMFQTTLIGVSALTLVGLAYAW